MKHKTLRAGAALLVAAAQTTSCGGGDKKKNAAPTTIARANTATTTGAASTTGSPANGTTPTTTAAARPSQASVVKLGDRVDTAQGNVNVYAYEDPVSPPGATPHPGNVFADIDAEGCAGPNAGPNTGIGPQFFYLQVDQSAYHPVGTSKEPALRATRLAPGQCARGWVTFELPQGAKPQYAIFNSSKVIAWQLP